MFRTRNGSLRGRWMASVALIALGVMASAWEARALTERSFSFDEMVALSDQITVAVCEGSHTTFRNGNVVTVYKLRAVENWKGQHTSDVQGAFAMEMIGGSIAANQLDENKQPIEGAKQVRLGQVVPGTSGMAPGEEVLLFTQTRPAPPQTENSAQAAGDPTLLPGMPMMVSYSQGRFSVLRDPDTGEGYLVRPSSTPHYSTATAPGVQNYLNARQRALAEHLSKGGAAPARSNSVVELPDGIAEFTALSDLRRRVAETLGRN